MLETKQTIYTEPKKFFVCGLVNFVPAVAYLFCLILPAAFSQPRTKTFLGSVLMFDTTPQILLWIFAQFQAYDVPSQNSHSLFLSVDIEGRFCLIVVRVRVRPRGINGTAAVNALPPHRNSGIK